MSWNIPGHPNSDFSQLIINHFKVLIIPKDVDNGTIFLLRRNKGEINIFLINNFVFKCEWADYKSVVEKQYSWQYSWPPALWLGPNTTRGIIPYLPHSHYIA